MATTMSGTLKSISAEVVWNNLYTNNLNSREIHNLLCQLPTDVLDIMECISYKKFLEFVYFDVLAMDIYLQTCDLLQQRRDSTYSVSLYGQCLNSIARLCSYIPEDEIRKIFLVLPVHIRNDLYLTSHGHWWSEIAYRYTRLRRDGGSRNIQR